MNGLPERYAPTGEVVGGGLSEIHICKDTDLERLVALKVLKAGEETRRLLDEISALVSIRSDHVVQIYDLIYEGGTPVCLVEEFIDGQDLADMGQFRESLSNYLRFVWQLSEGLKEVHAHGVIHRDIKPNNIRVDGNGILKILDFGLARCAQVDGTIGFVGTYGFAAPEQYSDEYVEFTQAIDVYAFGVTCMWMALEVMPVKPLELKDLDVDAVVNCFQSSILKIPDEVVTMLARCMACDPGRRPAMSEIETLIGAYLLRDTHQALLVSGNNTYRVNCNQRKIALKYGQVGGFTLSYDGLKFTFVAVQGSVYLNNAVMPEGQELVGSCVVAIGGPEVWASERAFITVDISHPEVAL